MATGDTNLQLKFQQLQEQQQLKLVKRQQQKEKKRKTSEGAALTREETFGVEDDLNLGVSGPKVSSNDYISDELVQHLNDQIRELKDETGRLYKVLSEKDYELRFLARKREEDKLHSQTLLGPSNETAASKIVELSKKVRELSSEVESEKTKAKQMARKCKELEREKLQTSNNPSQLNPPETPAGFVSDHEHKTVCDKLRAVENKAAEVKMQQQALKQEIQKLTRALSQEVGEGYNLQSLLANNSSWRGRSQQILLLQKKVNEFRTELNHYKLNQSEPSLDGTMDESGTSLHNSNASSRRINDESQTRERIRKIERDRKETLERSANELQALEVDYEDLKTKLDGSKARSKVLSGELKSVKSQVTSMLEKGKNDDDLIKALMGQLETYKKLANDATELHKLAVATTEDQRRELSQKTQQDSNTTEQLKSILAQKDKQVNELEEELNKAKQENLQLTQMNSVNQIFEKEKSNIENKDREEDFSPDELDDDDMSPSNGNPSIGNPSIGNPSIGNPSNGNLSNGNPSNGNPSNNKTSSHHRENSSHGNRRKRRESDGRNSSDGKNVHFTPRNEESSPVPGLGVDILAFNDSEAARKVPTSPGSRNNSARSIGSCASDMSQKPPRPGALHKPASAGRPGSRNAPPSPVPRPLHNNNSYAQKHTNSRPNSAQNVNSAESQTLQKAAEIERDRLNEFVTTLQFRINELTVQMADVSTDLQNQKRQNVTLEKQLGKSKVEMTSLQRSGSMKSSGKLNRSQISLSHLEADLTDAELLPTDANIRDLQLGLALQQDENRALKTALQTTLQAKEDDLRIYQETITETRKIFLQGIRQFKKSMS